MSRSLLLVSLVFLACPSNPQQMPPPTPDDVWAKTTVPFDPTCAQCTEIGAGSLSHIGEGKVLIDKRTDDPPAQWGRCIMGFLKCVDGNGAIPACVESAPCPTLCKAEFKKQLGAGTAFDAQVAAMDHTFFDDGALCNAPQQEEVTP